MKDRILVLLFWIIVWMWLWVYTQYDKKIKQDTEVQKIINNMKILDYKNKEKIIKSYKQNILWNIDKNDSIIWQDKAKYANFKIIIYNYQSIYKEIYDYLLWTDSVKELVWYKNFQNTLMYKRLAELREWLLHTKIIYDNWKEKNYDYIPIDISCEKFGYCKKIINKDINEWFLLDKRVLTIKDIKKIKISEQDIIKLFNSNKTLYDFVSQLKATEL